MNHYKTPHSSMQSASNFIMGIFLIVILVMAFSRCTTQRTGCAATHGNGRHFVGY
jgi:hypothetical protein